MRDLLVALFGGFDAMLDAVPLAAARWVVVGFFVVAAGASFLLPREFVYRGAPQPRGVTVQRGWARAG
jgi:hypothetical protein